METYFGSHVGTREGFKIFICLMSRKNCNQNYRLERVCGHSWVRYPMDMMLGWVLVVLIIGCVVVYGVRTQTASDRPSEPRRRSQAKAAVRRPRRSVTGLKISESLR